MSVENKTNKPTISEETQILIGGLKNNVARFNNLYKDMQETNNIHKIELVENWIETARYLPKLAKKLIWKYIHNHSYNYTIKSSLIDEKTIVEEVKIEKIDKKGNKYYESGYIHYNKNKIPVERRSLINNIPFYRDRYEGMMVYKIKEPQEYYCSININKTLFDIDVNKLLALKTETIQSKYKWIYMDIFTPKENFTQIYKEKQQLLEDESGILEENEEKTAE